MDDKQKSTSSKRSTIAKTKKNKKKLRRSEFVERSQRNPEDSELCSMSSTTGNGQLLSRRKANIRIRSQAECIPHANAFVRASFKQRSPQTWIRNQHHLRTSLSKPFNWLEWSQFEVWFALEWPPFLLSSPSAPHEFDSKASSTSISARLFLFIRGRLKGKYCCYITIMALSLLAGAAIYSKTDALVPIDHSQSAHTVRFTKNPPITLTIIWIVRTSSLDAQVVCSQTACW